MKPPVFDPAWPPDVEALYRHDMQEIWDDSIARQIWNQYHNQLDIYLGLAGDKPLRILDVGCAQGTLALMLAERGHQVVAVDIRPQFLDYARSRYTHGDVQFLAANVLEDELPGGHDLIFANQIIEHLLYPAVFLDKLGRLLRPGGRLVATTPNGHYVRNSLPSFSQLKDLRDWEHLQNSADGDGHFFAYLDDELRQLFLGAGFDDVSTRFFESPFISGHMKIRHFHRLAPGRLLRILDRGALAVPFLGRRCAHQLLVSGRRPNAS
jgi:2-polyprenyl-3-methyl-5-hydroxy-6-metoxy-1,4-benzoquinol methylase